MNPVRFLIDHLRLQDIYPQPILRSMYRQIYFTGVQALPFVLIVSLFVGGITVAESQSISTQLGAEAIAGKILIAIIVRELGPLLIAFIIIGRSGTAIATDIGSMEVTQEIRTF